MEEVVGAVKFIARDALRTILPIVGARVWTSVNRITWYMKGYTGSTGSLVASNMPAGINYYMVSKEGYSTASGTINVIGGTLIEKYVFMTKTLSSASQATGSLYVTSVPEGATVYLDDVMQMTVTPATIAIPEGDHALILTKPGYEDYATLVTISRGQISAAVASLMPV